MFLASGNEVFALLDGTETGRCLVVATGHPALSASIFGSDSLASSHAPGLDTGAGLGFPTAFEFFRPSKYLEPGPSPRERPGNTKTDYLPARGRAPGEGWGFLKVLAGREWG